MHTNSTFHLIKLTKSRWLNQFTALLSGLGFLQMNHLDAYMKQASRTDNTTVLFPKDAPKFLPQAKGWKVLTSALIGSVLLPSFPSRCKGDSMAPRLQRSAYFMCSVSVVAEMPARGPRLGSEPAVTEGSGICPGIMSQTPVTTAAEKSRAIMRELVFWNLNYKSELLKKNSDWS